MQEKIIRNLDLKDSLDLVQKYVLENVNADVVNKENVSREMFKLFFNVVELGKEVRVSLIENKNENSEAKIADIFLALVSICNGLNINLFDALIDNKI